MTHIRHMMSISWHVMLGLALPARQSLQEMAKPCTSLGTFIGTMTMRDFKTIAYKAVTQYISCMYKFYSYLILL